MNQCGSDTRVHPPRQAKDYVVLAHGSANFLHRLAQVVWHVPIVATAANIVHETSVYRLALLRMGDFRMELQGIELARFVRHAGNRRSFARCDELETGRHSIDFVAMACPHVEQAMTFGVDAILDILQEYRVTAGADLRIAELADQPVFDCTAQLRCHDLHTVADSQHRHAQGEDCGWSARSLFFSGRIRATRQDDSFGHEIVDELATNVERMQLAINT